MSSAVAIADILAFSELVDSKAVNGNPFTNQPIYIAACTFLEESAAHSTSNPTSRSPSLPPSRSLYSFDEHASMPPTDQGLVGSSNATTVRLRSHDSGITGPKNRANSDGQSKPTAEESLGQS